MKTIIVFFYLLNGDVVSYTASEFGAFKASEGLPPGLTCEAMIQNDAFGNDVRRGLTEGETMRAACYRSEAVDRREAPYVSVTIAPRPATD